MIPIFSFQKYLTNMQIRRSYDKKLTNDYESPKVTCGWNSLSELRPLYSLKSKSPPPPNLAPNFLSRIKIIL